MAGAAVGVVALWAAPAAADDDYPGHAEHGSDTADVYINNAGSYVLIVEDNECDNHRVWAEWVNYNSSTVRTLTDTDGCGGEAAGHVQSTRISSLRVCERTKGCSEWVPVPRP